MQASTIDGTEESHGYRNWRILQVCGACDRPRARRGRERAGANEPFRVREAKAGMDTAGELHHHIGDLFGECLRRSLRREWRILQSIG
jgi:hypothetical protein